MINKQNAPRGVALFKFLTFSLFVLLVNLHAVQTFSLEHLGDTTSLSDQLQIVRNVSDSLETETVTQPDTNENEVEKIEMFTQKIDQNEDTNTVVPFTTESNDDLNNLSDLEEKFAQENEIIEKVTEDPQSNSVLPTPSNEDSQVVEQNIEDNTVENVIIVTTEAVDTKNEDLIESEPNNSIPFESDKKTSMNDELDEQMMFSNKSESEIVTSDSDITTTQLPAVTQIIDTEQSTVLQDQLIQMENVLSNLPNDSFTTTKNTPTVRSYQGAQVWRIFVQNNMDRYLANQLVNLYGGQLWKEVDQEIDFLLKPNILPEAEQYVQKLNLSRVVLIDNLQNMIDAENPSPEQISLLQNRKGHRLTWQAYHRLEDIHGFFDYLARTYPDICSVETIGYSIQRRPLKILKISNGNLTNPAIWIDGGMHPREWISPASVTFIANQIVEGWEDLPSYMKNINWHIHAVANPDGYEYTHTTDRLWRKNMHDHGRSCPGVDLNRNFGYMWGGKGTSANPCSAIYRGSRAFSEPETFYISKYLSSFPRGSFGGYLSFHSYGQYILYPWGYDFALTEDKADLDRVARQAATTITKLSGVKYTVGPSATTLYPAAGGSDDWAKGFAGIKYSYTIEMGDTGRYGFVLPAKYIESNVEDAFIFAKTVAQALSKERL